VKRVLAIGDIHGCFRALTALADYVNFRDTDTLITLGDYVDRGPDSRAVLDWLIAYGQTATLIPLTGNHELMMLAARDSTSHYEEWIVCGGDAALHSYARMLRPGNLEDVPDAHWNFIKRTCRSHYQNSTHFFVHANALPDIPIDDQPDYISYWEHFRDPPAHESGKIMVCGHTPQTNGRPNNIGHAVCIDTSAHRNGWLTCLNTTTGQYWQANESGETRNAFLDHSL
jgi:serine/threonine protein phosphatase 1